MTDDELRAELADLHERHGWTLDRMRSLEVRLEQLEHQHRQLQVAVEGLVLASTADVDDPETMRRQLNEIVRRVHGPPRAWSDSAPPG